MRWEEDDGRAIDRRGIVVEEEGGGNGGSPSLPTVGSFGKDIVGRVGKHNYKTRVG